LKQQYSPMPTHLLSVGLYIQHNNLSSHLCYAENILSVASSLIMTTAHSCYAGST
jgi:hypothetical protein